MTNTTHGMDGLAKEVRAVISMACTEAIAALFPEGGSFPLDVAIVDKAEKQLLSLCRRERAKEWDVIYETLHSSSLIMQEHINKVMTDRLFELRSKS